MQKIPDCDRCRFNLRNPYIVCQDYPTSSTGGSCPYFAPDLNAKPEELWEPEGASYYNGEIILQPRQRWTMEEQLDLLDTHPLFTGNCPNCSYQFSPDNPPQVHWDCLACGWVDDTCEGQWYEL